MIPVKPMRQTAAIALRSAVDEKCSTTIIVGWDGSAIVAGRAARLYWPHERVTVRHTDDVDSVAAELALAAVRLKPAIAAALKDPPKPVRRGPVMCMALQSPRAAAARKRKPRA